MANIPESMLNAELESWDHLVEKIEEAMKAAEGKRYNAPFIKLREVLEMTKGFRDAMKQLHKEFRKEK